jgi:hypothetical protein
MTFLLLSLSVAHAGKLADGWRGRPYGPADALSVAPGDACVSSPEAGVRWRCTETIATEQVSVAYMAEEGIYSSVLITCKGFSSCQTVLDTLLAAWGRPFSVEEYGTLPDRFWKDGPVIGAWSYNQFSTEGTAMASHLEYFQAIKAKQAAKARTAADDL